MGIKDWWNGLRQDNEYTDASYEGMGYDTSSSAVSVEEAEDVEDTSRFTYGKTRVADNAMPIGGFSGGAVKVVKPEKLDDVLKEPVRFLRENKTLLLNLEKVKEDRRRIVDFFVGVVSALDGRIVRVAACTYLVTPRSVEVSGDYAEENDIF